MTNPAELCFDDECFSARYFTSPQYLRIWCLVLPLYSSNATQATHVKLIEAASMPSIGRPRLVAVQQFLHDVQLLGVMLRMMILMRACVIMFKICCVDCPSLRTPSSVDEYSCFSPDCFLLRKSQVPAYITIIINVLQ